MGDMEVEFERTERPDLRCREHCCLCEVLHGFLGRLMILEQRVRMLEEKE